MNERKVALLIGVALCVAGCEAIFASSFNCNTDNDCPLKSQGQHCVQNRCVGGGTTGDGSPNNSDGSVNNPDGSVNNNPDGSNTGADAGVAAVDGSVVSLPCSNPALPYTCGALQEVAFLQYTITDVGVTSLGAGKWLVGVASNGDLDLMNVDTTGATITSADAGDMVDNGFGYPAIAGAVGGQPLSTSALVAGFFPHNAGGNFTSDVGCWSPLNAAAVGGAAPNVTYDLSANSNEVDFLRMAVDGQGILGFVWSDLATPAEFLAIGSASGTCPPAQALNPTTFNQGAVAGASIAPLSTGGFVVAEVSLYSPLNQLAIAVVPDGGVGTASFGTGAGNTVHMPAVATDGTVVTALVSDNGKGIQLFQGPLNNLSNLGSGPVIFPPPAGNLTAVSCGSACTLAGWRDFSANPQVYYALIDNNGCGTSGYLGALAGSSVSPVDMSVAYDVGTRSALLVVGFNTSTFTNVMASYCTHN